jgi:hypothetical protein
MRRTMITSHLQCPNNPQAIQAAVEKYTGSGSRMKSPVD